MFAGMGFMHYNEQQVKIAETDAIMKLAEQHPEVMACETLKEARTMIAEKRKAEIERDAQEAKNKFPTKKVDNGKSD